MISICEKKIKKEMINTKLKYWLFMGQEGYKGIERKINFKKPIIVVKFCFSNLDAHECSYKFL